MKQRTLCPPNYPPRALGTSTTWDDAEDEAYHPTEYNAPVLLTTPKPDWADEMNPNVDALHKRRTYCYGDEKAIADTACPFDDARQRYRNPMGPTGLIGRGLLGKWGPNHAADVMVTRRNTATNQYEVLLVVKHVGDSTSCLAYPAGMVEPGATVHDTLREELTQEAVHKGATVDQLFATCARGIVYRGHVDDHRNTDEAWMETTAFHYHATDELGAELPLAVTDEKEIKGVKWYELNAITKMYASHYDWLVILRERVAEIERTRLIDTNGDNGDKSKKTQRRPGDDTPALAACPPTHEWHGGIDVYELTMRREYAPTHKLHGRIDFYKDGEHVRSEMKDDFDGYIDFYENGKRVRREHHGYYNDEGEGTVDFYEENGWVRRKYTDGMIKVFMPGDEARTERYEFAPEHERHGEIHFSVGSDGRGWRIEYAPTHEKHGCIDFYRDENEIWDFSYDTHVDFLNCQDLQRREYAPTHPCHGFINFVQQGKLVRREYATAHKLHGCIDFVEDGKHVRTEYAPTHEDHGHIDIFEDGKHMRREYAPKHEKHGCIEFFEENVLVRREFALTHDRHYIVYYFENGKCVRKDMRKPNLPSAAEIWRMEREFPSQRLKRARGSDLHELHPDVPWTRARVPYSIS